MSSSFTKPGNVTSARAQRSARSSSAGGFTGSWMGRLDKTNAPPLYMSDVGLIGSLILALLFVISPSSLPFERITVTKHLPMILGAISLLMAVCAAALDPKQNRQNRAGRLGRVTMPFILLAGWIIAGSLYARFIDGVQNTFLTIGLYMLAAPGIALHIAFSPARWRVVRLYMRSLSWAAAVMIIVMLAQHVETGGAYHELEYLVVPVGVYHALRPGSAKRKILLTTFYLFGGVVFLKLTGFIALAIALIYLWVVEWRFQFAESEDFRRWTRRCVVLAALVGGSLAAFLLHHHGKVGPDGNLGYRLITYSNAFHRFLNSPIYGVSFDASATTRFTGFEINIARGHLPTHSDLLDLAANGGLLALGLLVWAYSRTVHFARKTIFSTRAADDITAAAHALACTTLTGVMVYAFNPILLEPDRALLLWAATGILLGIAIWHKQTQTFDDTDNSP